MRVAPDEVSFAHPTAWNDILGSRGGAGQLPKDPIWWEPMPGAAPGILTAVDDELHSLLRRLMNPGFTSRALAAQEEIIHTYADLLIERFRDAIANGEG